VATIMNVPEDLQRAINNARAIVRFGFPWWLRLFLLSDVAGITLGRRIYIDGSRDVVRSVRHELIHVRQIAELGVVRFYWRWVSEYVSNRRRGLPSEAAYRRISLEKEAFAAEGEEIL
jgi:hypothetical protein